MRKSERLGLVLTPREKAAVAALAEAKGGLSMSAFIRYLIRREAKANDLWLPRDSRHEQEGT